MNFWIWAFLIGFLCIEFNQWVYLEKPLTRFVFVFTFLLPWGVYPVAIKMSQKKIMAQWLEFSNIRWVLLVLLLFVIVKTFVIKAKPILSIPIASIFLISFWTVLEVFQFTMVDYLSTTLLLSVGMVMMMLIISCLMKIGSKSIRGNKLKKIGFEKIPLAGLMLSLLFYIREPMGEASKQTLNFGLNELAVLVLPVILGIIVKSKKKEY